MLSQLKSLHINDVNTSTLRRVINADSSLIMIFFWEPDSLASLRMVNFVEQVADLCEDYMRVLRVNVREEQKLGLAHDIYRIPAFAFYQDGEHLDTIVTTDPIRLEEAIVGYIERSRHLSTRLSG